MVLGTDQLTIEPSYNGQLPMLPSVVREVSSFAVMYLEMEIFVRC